MSKVISSVKPARKAIASKSSPNVKSSRGAVYESIVKGGSGKSARLRPSVPSNLAGALSTKAPPKSPKHAPSTRAKTLRLEPEFEDGLDLLKSVLGLPVNRMVNEAVGEYIEKRTSQVEADLGGLLAQVKAYRKADPDFKFARERFVKAEMKMAGQDPTDGTLVTEESVPPPGASRARKRG